jgi:hypothetical protein
MTFLILQGFNFFGMGEIMYFGVKKTGDEGNPWGGESTGSSGGILRG